MAIEYIVELYPHPRVDDSAQQIVGFSIRPPMEDLYDPAFINNANRENNGGRYLLNVLVHYGDGDAFYGSAVHGGEDGDLMEYAQNAFNAALNPLGNIAVKTQLARPARKQEQPRSVTQRLAGGARSVWHGLRGR